MRCCICGNIISGEYGCNPWPLWRDDDTTSDCCNVCDTMVSSARIMMMYNQQITPNVGDTIAIFYSYESTKPTEMIANGKFLKGEITKIRKHPLSYEGTWGRFKLSDKDKFVVLP